MLPVLAAFFVMGFVDAVGVVVGYARDQFALSGIGAALLPLAGSRRSRWCRCPRACSRAGADSKRRSRSAW
jgi:hypothetical protein